MPRPAPARIWYPNQLPMWVDGLSVVKRPEPMAARAVPRTAYGITKPVLETDHDEKKTCQQRDAKLRLR